MKKIIFSLSIFVLTIASLQAQSLSTVLDNNGSKPGMVAIRMLVAKSVNAQTDKAMVINSMSIEKGSTPLIIASTLGYSDVVRALLENNASVDMKDSMGQTALIKAGNREVADLLVRNRANVNEKNNKGFTALMVSASLGKADVAEVLIANNADINEVRGIWTPLIIASYRNKVEVVKVLVNSGAQVELKNNEGNIAFDFARTDEMKEMLYKYAFEKIGVKDEIIVEEEVVVEEPVKGKKPAKKAPAKKEPKPAKPVKEKAPKKTTKKTTAEAYYEEEDDYFYEDDSYAFDLPKEDLSKSRTLIVIPSIED